METNKKRICNYISEDKELNSFFKKLTIYCDAFIFEKFGEVNKPNLDKVQGAIKKLEECGIVLNDEAKEQWLNENHYIDIPFYLNYDVFGFTSFNGQQISEHDITVLKKRITYIDNNLIVECLTKSEEIYKEWYQQHDYNSMITEYSKEVQRHIKKTKNGAKTIEKSMKLKKLDEEITELTRLATSANFFEGLTYEQMKAIIDAKSQLTKTQNEYFDYFINFQRKKGYIEGQRLLICRIALKKMSQESSVEIDIKDIIKKMLVINLVVENYPHKEILTKEKEYDFDTKVVFSFLELKEEALKDLKKEIFDINNFSLAVDTVCEKVLKK